MEFKVLSFTFVPANIFTVTFVPAPTILFMPSSPTISLIGLISIGYASFLALIRDLIPYH